MTFFSLTKQSGRRFGRILYSVLFFFSFSSSSSSSSVERDELEDRKWTKTETSRQKETEKRDTVCIFIWKQGFVPPHFQSGYYYCYFKLLSTVSVQIFFLFFWPFFSLSVSFFLTVFIGKRYNKLEPFSHLSSPLQRTELSPDNKIPAMTGHTTLIFFFFFFFLFSFPSHSTSWEWERALWKSIFFSYQ